MLEQAVRKYQSRSIETAKIIEELIQLAKDLRAAQHRGEALGLSEDELAFLRCARDQRQCSPSAWRCDASNNCPRTRETVKRNTTIDWSLKESVRAKLRTYVRRTLRKYGYPPDKQEKAVQTVLEQAEQLSLSGPRNSYPRNDPNRASRRAPRMALRGLPTSRQSCAQHGRTG